MNARPDAPASRRNRDAILEVLRTEFANQTSVLEIGSGTGQHAVYFSNAMPHLSWQTSDRIAYHDGINAWIDAEGPSNVIPPVPLDVLEVSRIDESYDAVFSANTAHIMSMDAVRAMFGLVGNTLTEGGVFVLYGPFNIDGDYTSESNRQFDASLRAEDPSMGIRNLEELDQLAEEGAMIRVRQYAMPANNMINVWRKGVSGDD